MSRTLPEKSNSRKAFKYRNNECLNCGHPLDLSDRYCSYCSQLNTNKQLSLGDFFGEFVGSIITYDSRLRFTIKDLLFKPGTITRNYVHGQRLKYANPFRFFLSVSIIYFLLQSIITTFSTRDSSLLNIQDTQKNEVKDPLSTSGQNIYFTNGEGSQDTLKIEEGNILINSDTLSKREKALQDFRYLSEKDFDTIQWSNRMIERFSMYRDFYEIHDIKDPVVALDSLKHKNTATNRWLYDKNNTIEKVKKDPFGFANFLMGKIPFFLFFFTPVFAFFFWVLYSKKKYTYMEHMIFIFHIFSFLFLAMLICLLPDLLLGDDVFSGILFVFIGPFYFYKALRNFYKQNRFITIIKFVLLNNIFFISSTIAALLFFAITAATY
ncbi:DUF3667 domain-containing protein [Constantimarinum furrinae]|uniref:DUF3667 domain-containing protein n=1 Tax=Constantimarinum furrinae TaxID=2562285 RepID=A0A7G8PRC1_9FLAO|nr:DUF3667 domain-containing protein [Constantimarinum furrinae]QNJ96887.1 hypothetical protein ALE3EI_0300 [Constantimarinum furrinae]